MYEVKVIGNIEIDLDSLVIGKTIVACKKNKNSYNTNYLSIITDLKDKDLDFYLSSLTESSLKNFYLDSPSKISYINY
jgi:hypothetical protein